MFGCFESRARNETRHRDSTRLLCVGTRSRVCRDRIATALLPGREDSLRDLSELATIIDAVTLVHDGDVDITGDQTITQRVTGCVTVHPGCSLVLMGVAQDGIIVRGGGYARIAGTTNGLFVATGGHAVLNGTCIGSAINDGGQLTVEGTITGELITNAGSTEVGPSAVVRHRQRA
jgi:hypothetical protein